MHIGALSETGARIAAIYARVLNVSDVQAGDDFFLLGGTSLSAIALLDGIDAELGVTVPARDFYQATTVAELAELVDTHLEERV
jgi:acyl carrier protein